VENRQNLDRGLISQKSRDLFARLPKYPRIMNYFLTGYLWTGSTSPWTSRALSVHHKVPWLSSEKSLVALSRISCCISFNLASPNCPSRISASRVGSTSIATLVSFNTPRLRYLISLHNSDGILRAKVALQYFLRLSASATTFAFSG
jgi:hypothetical protein